LFEKRQYRKAKHSNSTATRGEIEKAQSPKCIAFFLPQFHEVQENNEWWGKGFTEWTNVKKAKPNFKGHLQPRVPVNSRYYDLSQDTEILDQIEMAKKACLGGFSFYFYWFNGRRILEKPLDSFMRLNKDFPFCITWANENWTKNWDGGNKEILLTQSYDSGFEKDLASDLAEIFHRPNYIRINNRPLFLIYRAKDLPNPRVQLKNIRYELQKLGIPDPYIAVIDFYDIRKPDEVGADALVEFPPHKFNNLQNRLSSALEGVSDDFNGNVFDYRKAVAQSLSRKVPNFTLFRSAMPSWDNTPRRQHDSTIFVKNTPAWFQFWLMILKEYTRRNLGPDEQFIFINAWNEWAEGAYIQPDSTAGTAYLDAIQNSTTGLQRTDQPRRFRRDSLRDLYNFYSETEAVTLRRAKRALRTKPWGAQTSRLIHSLQLHSPIMSKHLRAAYILIRKAMK
jgi:hypothetical protein